MNIRGISECMVVNNILYRPHYHTMLAVGMETGLALWNVDPSMMQSR